MYILKNASGLIVGFGETPFGVVGGQTTEEVEGTIADYESRLIVSANKYTIDADGVDSATVTITTSITPAPASIDMAVNGYQVPVTITGGAGSFEVDAIAAGAIVIEPWDQTLYSAAGRGTITVTAKAV